MAYFNDSHHQERYERFVKESNVGERETSIQTVLYLLSSIPAVSEDIEKFFNLKGKYMETYESECINLSTGEWIIVALAYNLYNGYVVDDRIISPHYALSWLDSGLRQVYFQALQLKTGMAS